jgi:hypothetical protein
MEDIMNARLDTLDEKALLAKNPKVAKIFERNKKKLESSNQQKPRKEYGLGLPYDRPRLASVDDLDAELSELENSD